MDTTTGNGPAPPARPQHRPLLRGIQIALSIAVVVAIFALILPKIASYADVWKTITQLTWLEMASLIAATIFNLFTYWWQLQAALPGLTLGQAAVNNQSSTTIANIMPGGGVVAVGLAYTMFRSWGFTGSEIALLISTTGIWNAFLKLGLPVVAVALLAASGQATSALLIPALIGLAILVGCIALFGMMLWKKEFANKIGTGMGKAWTRLRKAFRKPPVTTWGVGAVRFREQTIELVAKRWLPLTLTTVISHLALWFILLLSLRHVGVSEHEVSTIQVLAVFAFARLVSAAPITPGGVGLVELALIAGLYAAGRTHADVPLDEFKTQVTAAALLFRTLTYGIQIPLGGFTYMIWQRKRSWRKPQPATADAPPVPEGVAG
jgi:putative heme transporter